MKKHTILAAFLAFLTILNWSGQALASDPIYTGTFNNTAIKGYDVVSYFVGNGKPVKGSKNFQTKWKGANWRFASAQNLEKFEANPEKYAPQYGGYCAWAVAHGSLAKGDPLVYTLYGGKIYLNYNKSIHKDWLPRKGELITVADEKYPELVDLK